MSSLQYLAKYRTCFRLYVFLTLIFHKVVYVASRLRCGGIFYTSVARNLLVNLLVKEFLKLEHLAKLEANVEWHLFLNTNDEHEQSIIVILIVLGAWFFNVFSRT